MDTQEKLENLRHSLAHLLAAAVLELWPGTKRAIGPAIENGFYYDFDFGNPISEDDLPKIEAKMREILPAWEKFERAEVSPEEARKQFKNDPYKLELIDEFSKNGETLTLYQSGDYIDLCRGGHVANAADIDPRTFKLTKLAGAYWRGNEKNPQLTRIYGAAFETTEELEEYLAQLEEAKKRDHRVFGKELGLFVFSDIVGPGLPLYTPKGTCVLNAIKDYSRDLRRSIGYREVQTPNMNKGELFHRSGHYEKFRSGMFLVKSNYTDEEYFLKPMNCPQHAQLYASEPRSWRDLPVKFADFALLYRDEKPGELAGLTRLRSFSQDDGHCFLREDQVEEEFSLVLGVIHEAMRRYGLSYRIRLSLRDEKNKGAYLGEDSSWKTSQAILKGLLEAHGVSYVPAVGEAAFYGPKMDLIVKDSLGREWQLSTIQLDFNMPARFGLTYTDTDGSKKTPAMIHSALVGSPERFLGILTEHYAGAFPFWLSPVQVAILTINEKHSDYVKRVSDKLGIDNIRVEVDERNESIGKKIREAEMQKVPYILVIGDKEVAANAIALRKRGAGDQGSMALEECVNKFANENKT